MEIKLLKVRDKTTFLPVIAISDEATNDGQSYLLRGYAGNGLILLNRLRVGHQSCDPYSWNDRTMATAHQYIQTNFSTLKDGDVIDAFIR